MELRDCPAWGCEGGRTSLGTCMVCGGGGRVRVAPKDPDAAPGKCPYRACGDICGGAGHYDSRGITMHCWVGGPADQTTPRTSAVEIARDTQALTSLKKDIEFLRAAVIMSLTGQKVPEYLSNVVQSQDVENAAARFEALAEMALALKRQERAEVERLAGEALHNAAIVSWITREMEAAVDYALKAAALYDSAGSALQAQEARTLAAECADRDTGGLAERLAEAKIALSAARTPVELAEAQITCAEILLLAGDTYGAEKHLLAGHPALVNATGSEAPPSGDDVLTSLASWMSDAQRDPDKPNPMHALGRGVEVVQLRLLWSRYWRAFCKVYPDEAEHYSKLIQDHRLPGSDT